MSPLQLSIEGVGLWSPQLADFAAFRRLIGGAAADAPSVRPAATTLPPNERRRAPLSVLLAIEVAGQAVAMSGLDAATLPCVFASGHGDQSITDYMCATLADTPTEMSPTRFHNSVHNAPVGYWTMATGCHAPSTALAAHRASFGAGLLEAATMAIAEARPVLLVCSDSAGPLPLLEVTGCSDSFGCALVIAPAATAASLALLSLQVDSAQPVTSLDEPLASWRAANPSAEALPLLKLLAENGGTCQINAAPALGLGIELQLRGKDPGA